MVSKRKNTDYTAVCQMHISLMRKFGGKCSPLYVEPDGGKGRIKSTPENLIWLKYATLIHGILCFVKLSGVISYVTSAERNSDRGAVIGRTALYVYFAFCGFVGPGHLILKQRELATFLNFLQGFDEMYLGLGKVNGNELMKMIAFQAPSITFGCSGIIALQQWTQFERPGSLSYQISGVMKRVTSLVGWDVVRWTKWLSVGITVYELWDLIWALGLCVLPGCCGLFVGFGGVYFGATTILNKTRKPDYSLKESYCLYRRLQVFTSLINECFQDDFALWLMTFLMSWVVGTTAVIGDSRIRNSLDKQELYMCFFLVSEIYVFFVVGYSFPGRAHVISKRIRAKWSKRLVVQSSKSALSHGSSCSKFGSALERRVIRSFSDIKLRFGSVNFYGRVTALVITQFIVERSLKLMLLMER